MTKIGIVGCMGRMGQELVSAVIAHEDCEFAGGTEATGSHFVGEDIAGTDMKVCDDAKALFRASNVVIDFTVPVATCLHGDIAAETGTPLIVGTTGINDAGHAHLDEDLAAGGAHRAEEIGRFALR